MNEKTAPALWQQLNATVQVLLAVREGQSGSVAMEAVAPDLRNGVQALAFHAWRQWGRAVALRSLLAPKTPPPAADVLLCLVLALLWSKVDAPYDDFTLVNQAVEAAKANAKAKAQSSFINACLRRFLRERDALVAATSVRQEALWNHPLWWIQRVRADHPDCWQSLLAAANRHPPMSLRVNVRKSTPAEYAELLHAQGIKVSRVTRSGVELAKPVPVHTLPHFAEGFVSVQDGAAQMAAELLLSDAVRFNTGQERILDACAAPGGKTAHLLERSDAQVVALEVDPARADRITQTLTRLGLQARVQVADAGQVSSWWDGQLFDRILLDAPCTASGIVRRHPDIRWLRRESDIAQLAAEQQRLLKALWPLLREGGRFLYCTCSLFKAEGADQVDSFLAHHKDAVLLPSPGHLLPRASALEDDVSDNGFGDHDGFFYALFEKKSV